MRMLMNITIPPEPFNTLVREGTAGSKIKKILAEAKAEAVYFTERDGERGAVLVVNIANASDVPALAEPWYLSFEAAVEFRVAMTPDDLARSDLGAMGKKWG